MPNPQVYPGGSITLSCPYEASQYTTQSETWVVLQDPNPTIATSEDPEGWQVVGSGATYETTATVYVPEAAALGTGYSVSLFNSVGGVRYSTTSVAFDIVPPPPTLTASPACLCGPGNSTLTWDAPGATQVTIDQGVGTFTATSGQRAVSVSATTTYTLTATYPGGVGEQGEVTLPVGGQGGGPTQTATATVTVSAMPSVAFFTASPSTIQEGATDTLSWATTGASSVSISGLGAVAPSGAAVVSPASSTAYTLTATNGCCQATAEADVTVTPPPTPPTPALAGLQEGQSVELSWGATPAGLTARVLRGLLSGGPYAAIASGITDAGYDDNGLPERAYENYLGDPTGSLPCGVRRFYVAQFLDGPYAGPLSNEVSAVPVPGLNVGRAAPDPATAFTPAARPATAFTPAARPATAFTPAGPP